MTVTPTYPGVYIREIPSGSRTITGVATSITAFVGMAPRGPVNEPVPIAGFGDFERAFGGLSRDSGLGYAVRDFFTNGGSSALVVRVVHEVDDPNDPNDVKAAPAQVKLGTAAEDLVLEASGPGAWAKVLEVDVSHPTGTDADDIALAQGVLPNDLFTLVVREGSADDAPSETFLNVTRVDGPRRVDLVLAGSTLVRVVDPPPTAGRRPAENVYAASGGVDGDPPTPDDYRGSADLKTGMHALLKADLFNLLCIPPTSAAGDLDRQVWTDAAVFCTERRAFLIVDPPAAALTTTAVTTFLTEAALTGANMRNAALYFPRINQPDPLRGGSTATFAACGAIAGTFARTDGARGVWKAPAGIDAGLAGVVGLPVPLTDADNGILNPLGINCLRTFRAIGTVVWGARTLRGADRLADEYKYVPVRRLALFLEETLYRSTQWVVFEPNDEPLWAQIRLSVGAFLQSLFRQGAFQGTTPREAYFVRCDRDTTTQYDIDRGIVNIIVGFAPLKPAEFVVIGIGQIAGATP